MSSPGHGRARSARAALLASVVLTLALVGHRLGGGALPTLAAVGGLWVALVGPCAVLARGRLRWPTLVSVLGTGQAGLHLAFGALTAAPSPIASGMPSGHDHMALHGIPTLGADASMTLAHLGATVVTAALLAWGERALWALWERLRARPLPTGVASPSAPRRPVGIGPLLVVGPGLVAGLPLGRAPPGRS